MRQTRVLLWLFGALLVLAGSHGLVCGSATLNQLQRDSSSQIISNSAQELTLIDSNNIERDDHAVMAPGDLSTPEETPVSNPTPTPVARPPHTDLPPVEYIAQQTPNQKLLKWYLIGGIGGGGLLLIIIIIIGCCCCCALNERERIANSVKVTKTVKKENSNDPAKPVPSTVAAAIAAAALNPSSSQQPAAASEAASSASAPPRVTIVSNTPNANVALAALGSVRMKQSPLVSGQAPQELSIPLTAKSNPSSSSSTSESSSASSSEDSSTSSSSEESSEEESSSVKSDSETKSATDPEAEPVTRLNYDLNHVDDQGFDEW